MTDNSVYKDIMDIIEMHKAQPHTENDTELFCERIGSLIDKHFIVKDNLTQEQYGRLWAALPK